MSDDIKIEIEGRKMIVPKHAYVEAKTKQLRGFGYADLSKEAVANQLELILLGKTLKTGLDVIGGFMIDEIILPEPPPISTPIAAGKNEIEVEAHIGGPRHKFHDKRKQKR